MMIYFPLLNGRKLGDLNGHFTCYSHVGQPSVTDYILCHESLLVLKILLN